MFTATRKRFGLILPLLMTGMLSGCLTTGAGIGMGKSAAAMPGPSQVELFYATDRGQSSDASYFNGDRSGISFGVATVGIPAGHVMGRHESPSLFKFELNADERKHIALNNVEPLELDAFADRLSREVEASPGHKVMVFVHGYNTSFKEASELLAQFSTDLKFRGPVVLFSWPSQGSLSGYTVDETNAEYATLDLVRLLDGLLDRIPARDIYLMGHSMGNRVLARAVSTLATDRPLSDLGVVRELIMVAPDIDADVFRNEMAPRLARTGIHMTLYSSSGDRALMASKAFHGYARAGESGDGLVVVDGVETIDASGVSSGLLGHNYFAEDRRIMEDIYSLLQSGARADARFGLKTVEKDGQIYYTFRN